MRLSESEITELLQQTDGWQREDEKFIRGKYRFSSFANAIAFVNQVAQIAEQMNHHPFIAIDYKLVTLRITSWHARGLTKLDFESVAAYNKVYER